MSEFPIHLPKPFIVLQAFIILPSHPSLFQTGELKSGFAVVYLAALLYLISSFLTPALRLLGKDQTLLQAVKAL